MKILKYIVIAGLIIGIMMPLSAKAAIFSTRVIATSDDAVERSDDTNFTSDPVASLGSGIVWGRSGATGNPFWYSGHRFQNVTIPQGTVINSAKITFTPRSSFSMSAATVSILGHDVDNSVEFDTTNDVVNRVVTTASVAWSAPTSATIDVAFDTSDITSVVQEIINRVGWVSGNALTLLFKETAGTAGESSDLYYYENSATKDALLTIDYVSVTSVSSSILGLVWSYIF